MTTIDTTKKQEESQQPAYKMSPQVIKSIERLAELCERLATSKPARHHGKYKTHYEGRAIRVEREQFLIADQEQGHAVPNQKAKYGTTLALFKKGVGFELFHATIVENEIVSIRYLAPAASENYIKELEEEMKRSDEKERSRQTGLVPIPFSSLRLG